MASNATKATREMPPEARSMPSAGASTGARAGIGGVFGRQQPDNRAEQGGWNVTTDA